MTKFLSLFSSVTELTIVALNRRIETFDPSKLFNNLRELEIVCEILPNSKEFLEQLKKMTHLIHPRLVEHEK